MCFIKKVNRKDIYMCLMCICLLHDRTLLPAESMTYSIYTVLMHFLNWPIHNILIIIHIHLVWLIKLYAKHIFIVIWLLKVFRKLILKLKWPNIKSWPTGWDHCNTSYVVPESTSNNTQTHKHTHRDIYIQLIVLIFHVQHILQHCSLMRALIFYEFV